MKFIAINIAVLLDGMNPDELISSLETIECGSNPQNTDFDSAITNAMINLHDIGSGSDERRLLNLTFCDVQDSESDYTRDTMMINEHCAVFLTTLNRLVIATIQNTVRWYTLYIQFIAN